MAFREQVQADPLALEPVSEQNAIDIARAWAGAGWTGKSQERLRDAMRKDPELSRPLFAALLGHAIGTDGLPAGDLNPITVAATALAHQFRSVEGPSSSRDLAKDLFAAATAGQGVPENELLRRAETITGEKLTAAGHREVAKSLRRLNGTAPDEIIPPLEPDFLGGLFVLEQILHAGTFALGKADGTAAAWAHSQMGASRTLRRGTNGQAPVRSITYSESALPDHNLQPVFVAVSEVFLPVANGHIRKRNIHPVLLNHVCAVLTVFVTVPVMIVVTVPVVIAPFAVVVVSHQRHRGKNGGSHE